LVYSRYRAWGLSLGWTLPSTQTFVWQYYVFQIIQILSTSTHGSLISSRFWWTRIMVYSCFHHESTQLTIVTVPRVLLLSQFILRSWIKHWKSKLKPSVIKSRTATLETYASFAISLVSPFHFFPSMASQSINCLPLCSCTRWNILMRRQWRFFGWSM
jgi:hypothetical protein